MSVFPFPAHAPLFIASHAARFTPGHALPGIGVAITHATAAWPANNLAIYVPLVLPFAYPVKRAFWGNGGGVSGNVDLGIFLADTGAKILSTGATAQVTTNVTQYKTVDWLIPPGEYYIGLSLSTTGGSIIRSSSISVDRMRLLGYGQQATAHPLPSTMTLAACGQAYLPLFGLTRTSSGF